MTSPVKARVRPRNPSAGLGASNFVSSRNRSSRSTQTTSPALTILPVPQHVSELSSSLPTDTTSTPRRGLSEHSSSQEPHHNSLPKKSFHDGSSALPSVDPRFTYGPKQASARPPKVNSVKPSLSTTIHRPDSHTPTSPREVGKTRLLDSRASHLSPNSLPFLIPISSPVPLHLPPPPINSRTSVPVNPPLDPVDLNSRPVHPNSLLPSPPIPYLYRLKGKTAILGMSLDDAKPGGMRGTFLKDLEPPPNPSFSVVMEILPRKFRTVSFILDWLSQFTFQPSRYELVEGKVFFEFKSERDARLAWNSPRMGGQEGLLGVRLFWYRVPPQPALEKTDTIQKVNTTGTIENPVQPRLPLVSSTKNLATEDRSGLKADLLQLHILTHKSPSPPPPPPRSIVNVAEDPKVSVKPSAEDIRSTSDNQTPRGISSSGYLSTSSSVLSTTTTTSPSSAPTPPSNPPDKGMSANDAMEEDPPSGGVPDFIQGVTVSPTLVSTPLSPISTLASSSSQTSPSFFPTVSPTMLHSPVLATFVDHQAPIALNQEPMLVGAETPHLEAEIQQTEIEKVDRTAPHTDSLMETDDATALAKEQALREMVLRSRKRKLLGASGNQQSTSAMTSTVSSGKALEELAANFIADAIARPRPIKRVKITPSPSAMAAWGKRLEQHVQSSKAIMAKIQSTQAKSERNRLLAILREKDRCVSRWHTLNSPYFE